MILYHRELGQGEPVLILHGVFGTSDNWLTAAKGLAENYKVYMLDLRNHGQSFHSEEFSYEVMAKDISDFLDHYKINSPTIIGHSMGGKVAMQYARDFDNFRKLVVVDISPRFYKRHHDQILDGLNSLDLNNLNTRQQADEELARYITEFGVRQFLLKNLSRSDDGKFEWKLNLKILTEKIDIVGQPLDEATRITKPTLFIRGGNSGYIQEKDEVLIHKIFSDVRISTIEGAGHWVHAEKPKEMISVLEEFIG